MTEKKIKNNMSSSDISSMSSSCLTRGSKNKDLRADWMPDQVGHDRKEEQGRSMVEMLGVLAIVGVLSVGGIAGYTYAMNRHYANELLNGASQRAVIVAAQLTLEKDPNLDEFAHYPNVGGTFGQAEEFEDGSGFVIAVSDVKEAVCENLKKMTEGTDVSIAKDDETLSEVTCSGDNNAFLFVFDYGVGGGAGDACETLDCGAHGTCEDGACKCDVGYMGDKCDEEEPECSYGNINWNAEKVWNEEYQCDTHIGLSTNEYCREKDKECRASFYCPETIGEAASMKIPHRKQGVPVTIEGDCDCPDCQLQSEQLRPCVADMPVYYDREYGCVCNYVCYTGDTPIMLADGTCKRADEITYDDELLVWDFDNGCFAKAKPLWIKQPQVAQEYNYLRFSDGSELKTINQHRIFNKEAGKFTYPMTDETPIGTTTFNAKGEYVTLVEKRVVQEEVVYYNIITDYHLNCFTGNILTSCRLNNLYPIKDMKFVKDDRELVPYSEYAVLSRKWYDGLRLAEQPREINPGNAVRFGDNTVTDYVLRLIRMAQPESNAKAA